MADDDVGGHGSWRVAVAAGVGLMVLARIGGIRTSSDDRSPGWLSDEASSPAWLSVLSDSIVATIFCAVALVLLIGRIGLLTHVRHDRIAIVPAAACLCVGGAAVSAAIATVMGGWALGIEVFVLVSVVFAAAVVSLAISSTIMVVLGIRLYEMVDRATRPYR